MSLGYQGGRLRDFGRAQLVDAIDDDDVGLFELLVEDVSRLGGKTRSRFVAKDAQTVTGLEKDGVGGHLKALAV